MNPLKDMHKQTIAAVHTLRLILRGADQLTEWSITTDLATHPDSPPRFIIFVLPHPIKPPVMPVRQLDASHSQFDLMLTGPAAAAQRHDLSGTAPQQWMPTLHQIVGGNQAAVILLQNRGRLTVALHEGGAV
jgi:hypothetical protein